MAIHYGFLSYRIRVSKGLKFLYRPIFPILRNNFYQRCTVAHQDVVDNLEKICFTIENRHFDILIVMGNFNEIADVICDRKRMTKMKPLSTDKIKLPREKRHVTVARTACQGHPQRGIL